MDALIFVTAHNKVDFVYAVCLVIKWGLNSVEVASHVQHRVATTTSRFCFFESMFSRDKLHVFLLFLTILLAKFFMRIYTY